MSSTKNDGKVPEPRQPLPPTTSTVVGVPSLPTQPRLDLDMEELSGSLLVEEPPGRGTPLVGGPAIPSASTPPRPPAVPSDPPTPSAPPPRKPPPSMPPSRLPKPNPPPRPEAAEPAKPPPPPEELPTIALGQPAVAPAVAASDDLPTLAATQPAVRPQASPADGELATIPQSTLKAESPAGALAKPSAGAEGAQRSPLADSGSYAKRGRREAIGLGMIAVAGLAAGVALVLVIAGAVRRRDGVRAAPPPVPTAAESAIPSASPSGSAPGAAPTIAACAVAGLPHVVAPSAVVAPGVEARAFGDDIALGFAPTEHQALLVRLDATSLTAAESSVVRSVEAVRRVTPIPGKKGHLTIAVDVDRKHDPLHWRRTLPLDPPIQLGVSGGNIAWAPLGRGVGGKLWPLEGDDAVEAMRGARSESNLAMVAVTFRRAGGVWVGTAEGTGALVPKTDLVRVGSASVLVGAPAIAVNEGIVLMAWAERRSTEDAWQLHWVRFKAGDPPGDAHAFVPPAGGKGEQSMAPAIAVAPGGRFLLVWTEGPASAHEVRALTVADDGTALGDPLRISSEGSNAGQGQAAVTASGRGVVAFLESDEAGFRIAATPITCGL